MLPANYLPQLLSHALHHGPHLRRWEEKWEVSPRKYRLCLQIDSVCMNKHRLCKTSPICMWGKKEGRPPFPSPAKAKKFASQLSGPLLITIIIGISITVAVKASRTSRCSFSFCNCNNRLLLCPLQRLLGRKISFPERIFIYK